MNSWSRWTFVITPATVARRPDAEIRYNVHRFGRSIFGPSFSAKVTVYADGSMTFAIRANGFPVMDPRYVDLMTDRWREWAVLGWGRGTVLVCRGADPCEAPTSPIVGSSRVAVVGG